MPSHSHMCAHMYVTHTHTQVHECAHTHPWLALTARQCLTGQSRAFESPCWCPSYSAIRVKCSFRLCLWKRKETPIGKMAQTALLLLILSTCKTTKAHLLNEMQQGNSRTLSSGLCQDPSVSWADTRPPHHQSHRGGV